jgi:hypothetical protein
VPLRLVTSSLLDGSHMRRSIDVNRSNKFRRCVRYSLAFLQIIGEFLQHDIQTATSLVSPLGPYPDLWMREVYLVWMRDVTCIQNLGVHPLCASKSQTLLYLPSEAHKYKTRLLWASLQWQHSILWGCQTFGPSVEQPIALISLFPV